MSKDKGKTTLQILMEQGCKSHGIPIPVSELKGWHPNRDWSFDFAWPPEKIVLEVDGGVYGRGKRCPVCRRMPPGAHSSIRGIQRDIEKGNEAQMAGWKFFRCQPEDVATGEAFLLLRRAFGITD